MSDAALLEHRLRQVGGVDGGRPARVEGDVRDDLGDLLARKAVVEAAADMCAQLIGAVERGQHGDRHQAAVALRQFGPLPDVAEDDIVGQFDELGGHLGEVSERARALRRTHALPPAAAPAAVAPTVARPPQWCGVVATGALLPLFALPPPRLPTITTPPPITMISTTSSTSKSTTLRAPS